MPTTAEQGNSSVVHGLERTRKKLLDLTRNNRLLNFRHNKKTLRIIDELANQVYSDLVNEGEYLFAPVPLPKPLEYSQEELAQHKDKKIPAETHAKKIGIETAYDLLGEKKTGEKKHEDKFLQTLLYPEDLDRSLRRIISDAKTAQEESGVNMLFLCLGFLKWYESETSEVENLAPLVMIPIQIERDKIDKTTGFPRYKLTHTGEDILDNICLREKLLVEWSLSLPAVEEYEELEDYFSAVKKILKTSKPTWDIKRYATISLVSFGKMLMYLDLDPSRWPEHDKLTDHPIVSKVFLGADNSGASHSAGEYDIDNDKALPDISLIMDADSSQHSAIVDVLNNKNLVIEGPPGTGKSQTITNMIAACLERGKSVLFVAEKLAALEVVRRRLDQHGLGDFCLELHSHKTKKKEFIDDIKKRLALKDSRQVRNPANLDEQIDELKKKKSRLLNYSKALNEPFGVLEETPHQTFWKLETFRQEASDIVEILDTIESFKGPENHSQTQLRDITSAIKDLSSALKTFSNEGGQAALDFWSGLDLFELDFSQQAPLLECLKKTLEQARVSLSKLTELSEAAGIKFPVCNDIKNLSDALTSGGVQYKTIWDGQILLYSERDQRDLVRSLAALIAKHQKLEETNRNNAISKYITTEVAAVWPEFYNAINEQNADNKKLSHEEIKKQTLELSVLQKQVKDHQDLLKSICESLNLELKEQNLDGLKCILKLATYMAEIDPDVLDSREENLSKPQLLKHITELKQKCGHFREFHRERATEYTFSEKTNLSELRELIEALKNKSPLRFLNSDWREANKLSAKYIASKSNKKREEKAADLEAISLEVKEISNYLAATPLAGLDIKLYTGPDSNFERMENVCKFYDCLKEICLKNLRIGQKLYSIGTNPSIAILEFVRINKNEIQNLISALENLSQKESSAPSDLFNDWLDQSSRAVEKIKAYLPRIPEGLNSISLMDTHLYICSLKQEKSAKDEIINAPLFNKFFSNEITDNYADFRDFLSYAEKIYAATPEAFQAFVFNKEHANNISLITKTAIELGRFEAVTNNFKQLTEGLGHCSNGYEKIQRYEPKLDNIQAIHDRLARLSESEDYFDRWCSILISRKELRELNILEFIDGLKPLGINSECFEKAFRYVFYRSLAEKILTSNASLAKYTRSVLDNLRQDFSELDKTIIKLNQKKLAAIINKRDVPYGSSFGSPKNFTDLALLTHEASKQKRHIPIRSLVNRAGNALMALKPCFMMGPLSVAQYLKPGAMKFDIIIIDEASQVKPAEAVGAAARGGQIVVVGDSNQLPPTSFFDKMEDEDDDAEETAIDSNESILDVCKWLYQPNRRLRWHYRSQHHSLISFSNKNFYDNDLVVFPSPISQPEVCGVSYVHVQDGVYSSRSNLIEGQRLVEDLCERIKNHPALSYGVVTLNAVQKDLIEDLVERKRKEDALFDAFLNESNGSSEPFFVKNLENVQGDERDVIYISTTFGRDANGVLKQNFGPINGEYGWRRLNVLFTRAKRQVRVFSSMHPEEITADEKSSRGTHVLKGYLKFALSGIDETSVHTGKDPDSMFEVAVKTVLEAKGYVVVPQLGVAGYFIDLVVRHPTRPDYVMAIECDGATYHSAKSARDRDRLREENLRKLGWSHIHRIWSTDWFRNRKREEEKLLEALERAIEHSNSEFESVVANAA